ncbi:MAG: hypothetical protein Q8P69_01670 [bacterium]|nr:hypothetical protein [bacterium]
MADEQDTSINSVQAPTEATPVVPSESAPVPEEPVVEAETPAPVLPPEPVIPPTPAPEPVITPAPVPVSAPVSLKSFLGKAMEKIQFRKRAKLAKIVKMVQEKRSFEQAQDKSITNDDVQKFLRVSDATATRYLSELVRQGKLRRVGTTSGTRYEPFDLTQGEPTLGSNRGN